MPYLRKEARLCNLEDALDFVVGIARTMGFDNLGVSRIRLACEEILVNIIHHAYRGTTGDMEIEVKPISHPAGLSVTLSDSGVPFDPLSQVPPDTLSLPLNKRPVGGLGIHLVTTVMDRMQYARRDDKNVLELIKYL
jgi:serine/threonine-protein kinase RsbW